MAKAHIIKLDKEIAKNIRSIRKKLGISSAQICDYLNMSSSFVRNCECGISKYNVRHLYLIKEFFNTFDETIDFKDMFPSHSEKIIQELQDIKKINGKYTKSI